MSSNSTQLNSSCIEARDGHTAAEDKGVVRSSQKAAGGPTDGTKRRVASALQQQTHATPVADTSSRDWPDDIDALVCRAQCCAEPVAVASSSVCKAVQCSRSQARIQFVIRMARQRRTQQDSSALDRHVAIASTALRRRSIRSSSSSAVQCRSAPVHQLVTSWAIERNDMAMRSNS